MEPEEFHLQLHLSTQTSQVVFTTVFTTIFGIKSLFFHKPVWSSGGGRSEENPTVSILQPSTLKHTMTFLIIFSSENIQFSHLVVYDYL